MIYIYKAELIRVVDGDTVDLIIDLGFDTSRRERFRLYGIDAPEMRTKEGKAAKAWLEDAFLFRKPLEAIYVQTIQLSTKAKRDKYGRFLAVLYGELPALVPIVRHIHPASINAQMITEGHAKERYW